MTRPLQLVTLAVVTAVTLSGCGLLGGDGFEEYGLAVYEVTDADSKLDIILEEESSGVALAVFGSKDWGGSVEEIQGVAVADPGTNSFGIAYVDADGNPTSYETKEGWSFTFTNYSANSVDVHIRDPQGTEETVYGVSQDFFSTSAAGYGDEFPVRPTAETGDLRPQYWTSDDREKMKAMLKVSSASFCVTSLAITASTSWTGVGAVAGGILSIASCSFAVVSAVDAVYNEEPDRGLSSAAKATSVADLAASPNPFGAGFLIAGEVVDRIPVVTEGALVADWSVSEQSATSWSMDASLSQDGTFVADEGSGDFVGTWSFDPDTEFFQFNVPNGGSISGQIAGDLDDFSVDGTWANGSSGYFYWSRR